jgi:hypothetical protein
MTILLAGLAAVGLVLTVQAAPRTTYLRPAATTGPRLVPVAETRLLMEGLAQANFRGLERLLREKPDDEGWVFARGQALLIAETGNLLMLRPPRNPGEKAWLDRAGDLRTAASQLGQAIASHDLDKSRKALANLATRCNACHQTFRVKTRIVAFEKEDEEK